MKRFVLFVFAISIVSLGFYILKPYIASYLLTNELSSDEKVKEILALKDQRLSASNEAVFNNENIKYKPSYLALLPKSSENSDLNSNVLGVDDSKWIEVNLSQQRLNAWQNNQLLYTYLISSGRWAPTPVGDYRIWIKLASTTMKGGSKELGTYYNLPNVPCTMYFYKGYGIHGAYWHNNFGRPMSHGCVNMRPSESCQIFSFADVGTKVKIHY